MNLRDAGMTKLAAGAAFQVTLHLSVEDAAALWRAAAERAMAAPGMTLEEVIDTIGPIEDPAIAECLAMLTAPQAIRGCVVDDYAVHESPVPGATIVALAPLRVAAR